MPTPDEIYKKVFEEELAAGSSEAIARARAGAAKARAEGGIPTTSSGKEVRPVAGGADEARTQAVSERVQRLLAVVKPEALQRVERQPLDRVNVWPHLMAAEAVAL